MALRIFKRLRDLLDVDFSTFADGDAVTYDAGSDTFVGAPAGGADTDDQTAAEVPFTPAGSIAATNTQAAIEELDAEKAAAAHAHDGGDITTGTVADARIASTIARDSEVSAAIAAHEAAGDPHPGYTTAAELTAYAQPLDSDLTAVAALTTTAFGRGLLELANQAALLSAAGAQGSDSDLTAIAGLSPSNDDVIQRKGGAWTNRTIAQLLADLAAAGTTFQPLDADLTAIAALTTAAAGRGVLTLADPDADRIAFWDDSAGAMAWLTAGTGLSIAGTTLSAAAPDMQYESRSANTILGVADKGKTIDITAAITQTFDADETLGDGWWVILRNATTNGTSTVVLDPAGSETIDGLTTLTMYSGETRLIFCNGSGANFNSVLLAGGFARFTVDGNFIVPAGVREVTVECIGGGGGGGGGRGASAGTVRQGGTGGGGGARVRVQFAASVLGSAGDTIAVDVASGGTSGGGGSAANGSPGGVGGNTTFGSLVTGYGGGGGLGGVNSVTAESGGGGGGSGEAGQVGQSAATSRGGANNTSGAAGAGGAGGGSTHNNGSLGGGAEYGGAAGALNFDNGSGSFGGGRSVFGGGGGGSGGGLTTGNAETAGGAGGSTGTFALGATGGGTTGGTANGGAGGTGGAGDLRICGGGGAGGGSQDSGTGGAGGNGGAPGGGAGGGAGGTTVGGAGGVGGIGECRVWYS